jgi:hypothetical protein
MPYQTAVTVQAALPPDRVAEVRELLHEAGRKGTAGELFPFAEVPSIHFARVVLVPEGPGGATADMPPSVAYMGEVDGPVEAHLTDLVRKASDGLDRVFGHCTGYPAGGSPDAARVDWLHAHVVPCAAFYVNTVGRGRQQIEQEATLREVIEEFLDRNGPALAGRSPVEIRAAVQEYVGSREDLAWARTGPAPPPFGWRIRQAAHLVGVPLAALVLLPFFVTALPAWIVLLRLHERRDVPDHARPSHDRIRELAGWEDFVAQNPFTAVGSVKTGPFRRITLTAVLSVVDYGVRHVFNRGNLAGVKTIHFARWLFVDGKRRVIFASNYDGSLESYMDDFIDKVAWGLNAVFSNGLGYPRVRWLVLDGARDEQAFKNYLRCHQVPTQVWYSAYDTSTAHDLDIAARIRAGLFGHLGPAETEAWLALF